ncbi:MAG: 16S rRNA (guanine(527)-N(7))-methyltransferase RsmG [Spirochaetes bacterium]|nr:16S rRNA (guanine(527)-N(7))-methyltransferase RsmG [Spirochaetota bacterium]
MLALSVEIEEKLKNFAYLIFEYNKIINITGLKDVDSIYNQLIVESILPLKNINVPRGTSFIDIGTGAGIPGIPLLLYFGTNINGVLVDSNNKKIKFIEKAIGVLGLAHSTMVIQGRVEEMAHENQYRDKFDFAVARAFAHPYMALEYGLPFVKIAGWLYIYYASKLYSTNYKENAIISKNNSRMTNNINTLHDHKVANLSQRNVKALVEYLEKHSHALCGHVATFEEAMNKGIDEGFLFIKDGPTPLQYPRKYAIVKREVDKIRG